MNEKEIHQFLDKVINSKAFSHSDIYGRLLNYLTEATLNGKKPKEYTIGADVFNQKAESPSTSKVRVSVHNLRKKLDIYYKEEGTDDNIILTIPKGTYTLVFKKKKDLFFKRYGKSILISISALVIIAFLTQTFIHITSSDSIKLKKTKFWNELICNQKETIIVIGDFLIFQEDTVFNKKGKSQASRSDYYTQLTANNTQPNEAVISPNNNSYIPYTAIKSLPYLIPMLDRNNVNYKIILSSNFRWETYSDYNIIYIGSLKNLNALSYLTENKLHIKHKSTDNTLTVSDTCENRVYTSTHNNTLSTDYTLVAKLPGPCNNLYYLFGSNHEVGCIESIEYFTQIDSVKSFGDTKLKDANFFVGIFKAEGAEHINMDFELVEYKTITDTALSNFWH